MIRICAVSAAMLSCLLLPLSASATEDKEAKAETVEAPVYAETPQFVPVIGFMSPRHDFGDVEQGDVLTHEFEFLNNGGADLEIEDARSDVPGVGVGFAAMPIPVGEFGKVHVRVRTGQMEGEQWIRIHLKSNAHNGDSTLYLMMNVLAPE